MRICIRPLLVRAISALGFEKAPSILPGRWLYLPTATEYNQLEQKATLVVSDFSPLKRLAGSGTG